MTPRQKAFVKELNKTDAEKCIGKLADKEKRCVLAIACEVFIRDSGLDEIAFKSNGRYSWFGQESKHMPYFVKEYFGFRSVSGEFSEPLSFNRSDYYSLQHWNDESPVKLQNMSTFIKDNSDKIFDKFKDTKVDNLKKIHNPVKKKA